MITMERKGVSCVLLLLISFTALNAAADLRFQPNHLQQSDLARSKRRIQEVSASAIDYMQKLRDSLSDEEGRPTLANSDDPMEVWAMQDRGESSSLYLLYS